MSETVENTNELSLSGTVLNIGKIELQEKELNICDLKIKRKFESSDTLRLIFDDTIKDKFIENNKITVNGRLICLPIKSLTDGDDNIRMEVFVLVTNVLDYYRHDFNKIVISGYVFKPVKLRETVTRKILDIICTVQDEEYGSMCIPVIAWNYLAEDCKELQVGSHIDIVGRVQSREYMMHNNIKRIVYEVSASKIS
jgi:hypothetical protein